MESKYLNLVYCFFPGFAGSFPGMLTIGGGWNNRMSRGRLEICVICQRGEGSHRRWAATELGQNRD